MLGPIYEQAGRMLSRKFEYPAEYTGPNENAHDLNGRGRFEKLEHETRFELATPTLAKGRRGKQ